MEGIFRLAGSEKRIKELKAQFDTPPRWGKGLDWSGYTVHDAANILRRYFNQLPEPIIPLQYYDSFRQPLRGHQAEAVGPIEGQAPSVGGFDPDAAVHIYQQLIKELPSLNRQLLLYILDLLAVFAAKSDVNKMTTSNLAAIFQPGILSHPQHDMSPQDYRLSQDVLIFLIDNQDHFLIGMEGTAVDEGTVKHIESGPSTPQARTPTTPGRNKSGLGRSASAASSAGAESLRKYGGVRRNVSTSSRHSRHSGAVPSPTASAFTSSSGVHRSNTLPSKRSPALAAARFPREKERGSDSPTPVAEELKPQLPAVTPEVPTPGATPLEGPPKHIDLPRRELTLPVEPIQDPVQPSPRAETFPVEKLDVVRPKVIPQANPNNPALPTPGYEIPGAFPLPSPGLIPPTPDAVTPAATFEATNTLAAHPQQTLHPSPHATPKHEKSEFMEGSVESGPTTEQSSVVRTFTQILSGSRASPVGDEKHSGRKPNKLQKKRVTSANPSAHSSTHSLTGSQVGFDGPPSPLPQPMYPLPLPSGSKEALQSFNFDATSSRHSGATLKPTMSPSASFRSHSTATEYSETEQPEELQKEEKRSFWKSHKRGESKATPTASQTDLHGSVPGGDKSMSSFGSSSGWAGGGRRSLQYDSHQSSDLSVPYGESNKEAAEKRKPGPLGWLERKRQEHDERKDRKIRAKSPPGSSSDLATPYGLLSPKLEPTPRGRSMDMPRSVGNHPPKADASRNNASQDSSDVTPTGTSPNPLAGAPPVEEDTRSLSKPVSQTQDIQQGSQQQPMHQQEPPAAHAPQKQQVSNDVKTSQPVQSSSQSSQQKPVSVSVETRSGSMAGVSTGVPRGLSPNKSGLYPLDADIPRSPPT